LFDEFDTSGDGVISYREVAETVFGVQGKQHFSTKDKSVLERVKRKIVERGANGIRTITAILRRMDNDGSLTLDKHEFLEGLAVYGICDISTSDVEKLMRYFDRDGSGRISIEEFLRGVKGKMSGRRKKFVRQAFTLLDKDGSGQCTMSDFEAAYNCDAHPDVQAGRITAQEALEEFMAVFEGKDTTDQIITFDEFLDYYMDLSCGIEEDDYFELMMRNAWHISGGDGWCANTSCRRVLVTFADGSQSVKEIQNDLGVGADDIDEMRRRLIAQGDIGADQAVEISLSD